MGYELYVVRTRDWLDASTSPIGCEEWIDYARRNRQLAEGGWIELSNGAIE